MLKNIKADITTLNETVTTQLREQLDALNLSSETLAALDKVVVGIASLAVLEGLQDLLQEAVNNIEEATNV